MADPLPAVQVDVIDGDEEDICRICYQPGRLFTPCACKGSLQYAHSRCLKMWIAASGSDLCQFSLCFFNVYVIAYVNPWRQQQLMGWSLVALSFWSFSGLTMMVFLRVLLALALSPTVFQRYQNGEFSNFHYCLALSVFFCGLCFLLPNLLGISATMLLMTLYISLSCHRYLRNLVVLIVALPILYGLVLEFCLLCGFGSSTARAIELICEFPLLAFIISWPLGYFWMENVTFTQWGVLDVGFNNLELDLRRLLLGWVGNGAVMVLTILVPLKTASFVFSLL